MDINKQPGIIFKNIILAEENFFRIPNVPNETHACLNFTRSNIENIDNDYLLQIDVDLKLLHNDIEVLGMQSKFIGIFSKDIKAENMDISVFLQNNAPAIMFPYIREHITYITQKAGIKPIFLSPINLIALFENEKNKDISE